MKSVPAGQTGIEIPAKGCGHELSMKGTMPASTGWDYCEAVPLWTDIALVPNLAYFSRLCGPQAI